MNSARMNSMTGGRAGVLASGGSSCPCFIAPGQAEVAIIERFGKFVRVAQPGFNLVKCWLGECVAGRLSLRVQQLDVPCDTKTKDNVFISIHVTVQFQVIGQAIYEAFYRLTDSRAQIRSYVFDVVRSVVPNMNLDDVFVAKEEIAGHVKETLLKSMGEFGFQIIQALVTDIIPDAKVRAAMNDINAAQRQRAAALEKAEADKIMVVKRAEAGAEAKYLEGQGIARQRQAIVNGLRDSVVSFEHDVANVDSRAVIEMMMITQYFDVLRDVGTSNKSSTIFLNHSPQSVADLTSQMRSGFMEAAAANQTMTRE